MASYTRFDSEAFAGGRPFCGVVVRCCFSSKLTKRAPARPDVRQFCEAEWLVANVKRAAIAALGAGLRARLAANPGAWPRGGSRFQHLGRPMCAVVAFFLGRVALLEASLLNSITIGPLRTDRNV